MITFLRCDCDNEDFIKLTECLDADLNARNGKLQNTYDGFNRIRDISTALVAFDGDFAVGCGCFKRYDDTSVEIKRIFVLPEKRGHGIAKKLLGLLEQWAAELGYSFSVLETGKNQPEAISLYEKAGYARTENYGPYAGIENSVCFKKKL